MEADESMETSFADHESSRCHRPTDSSAIGAQPSASAGFDCSICLDFVVDPVVTLCGHLYCWPCIYKWLHIETISPHQCPVCKSSLSLNALVPLYGRGKTNFTSKSEDLDIPSRPLVVEEQHSSALYQRQPVQQHHNHRYYPSPWGGMGIFSSTTGGVLGGLAIAILSLVLRNNQSGRERDFPRPNHLMMPSVNSANQRMQRVENSLHQIWLFLFCCAILGLLFF